MDGCTFSKTRQSPASNRKTTMVLPVAKEKSKHSNDEIMEARMLRAGPRWNILVAVYVTTSPDRVPRDPIRTSETLVDPAGFSFSVHRTPHAVVNSRTIHSGTLHLKLPKATPGEHFKGLDMLTALLAPRGTRHIPSLPEEIGGDVEEGAESEDEFDWQWKQELYNEHEKDELCLPGCGYGFGNLRSGVFTRLQDELSEVADVKDPDWTSVLERRHARRQAEDAKFDSDHYLADLFECSSFPDLMLYEPWWKLSRKSQLLGLEEDEKLIPFGEEEKEAMLKLPRRKPCLLGQACQEALLGMVDILLAYAYDAQTTEGEPTGRVESPWTIRKLSGTLCWFEVWSHLNLHEVLVCFVCRVVCYPLFRRFYLALQAVADAADILKLVTDDDFFFDDIIRRLPPLRRLSKFMLLMCSYS
uniref:protein SHQ1 homolog n=1 Tax=Myxine glutinosa TaxID=7769 RepID=UPI00358FA6A1